MLNFLRKCRAFIRRDFTENLSYRAAYFLEFLSTAGNCVIFFFIAKLLGKSSSLYLKDYGGDYFPYVLIGLAFFGCQALAMGSFTSVISREQESGTLETLMMSPTRLISVLAAGSCWNILLTALRIASYLLIALLIFKVPMHPHWGSLFAISILTITSLVGLGAVSAGFVVVYKKGDPIQFLMDGLSKIFSGVYFPAAILPVWAKRISRCIPLTHALEAFRKAILLGDGPEKLTGEMTALFLFSLVLMPIGFGFLNWAVGEAKRQGSLAYH